MFNSCRPDLKAVSSNLDDAAFFWPYADGFDSPAPAPDKSATKSMVKPAYQNIAVEAWKYRQRLGTTPHSLCLFHNRAEIGRPILDALRELQNGGVPGRLTVTFAKCDRSKAVERLSLLYEFETDDLKVMHVAIDGPTATLRMTERGLPLVIDAIAAWLGGREDFCVAADGADLMLKELGRLDRESDEIWFWGPGYYAP